MSVRKRPWTNAQGEVKEAWVVNYTDGQGKRRLKTFARKKDADTFSATAHLEVREGVHIADSNSCTVLDAGRLWIAAVEADGRERSTVAQYRQHLDLHIAPLIGSMRISTLTVAGARAFEDRLRTEGRSPAMVRKVMVSLGSLLGDAQERGLASRNVIRDMRRKRGTKDSRAEQRAKGRLKVGIDIPTPGEIRAIVGALQGRWRPLLLTAIFTGLRSSELRGLAWPDVDLDRRVLHVRQRADRFKSIGKPKSSAGERDVPLTPIVVNTLREWRLACPKGELDLVFPDTQGRILAHNEIIATGFMPAQVRAGVVVDKKAKYTGLHSLRHFNASWLINRRQDGGLELPAKVVQERLGHSGIAMTMDTYGHLFPRGDDAEELAAAERSLLG